MGQPGEITRFVLSVDDTGNHNGIIEPGESALISVQADMKDDGLNSVGTTAVWNTNGGSGQIGTLYGFNQALFDIVALANGSTGAWSQLRVNPALNMLNLTGEPQHDGGVSGIVAVQWATWFTPHDPRDPLPLWSALWTPLDYAPRSISFRTLVDTIVHPHIVSLAVAFPSNWLPVDDTWDVRDTEISFQVVPAPASCLGVAVAALGAAVRRRR
ncbi:MAG: hypothetical protein ACKVU4_11420 [Phycisphaerales bacterium]